MKKINLYIFIFLSFIIFSCNNSGDETKTNTDTDTVSLKTENNIQKDTPADEQTVDIFSDLEILPEIFKKDDAVYEKFSKYMSELRSNITSEKGIIAVLKLQDTYKENFYNLLYQYFNTEGGGNMSSDAWQKVEKELKSIGFIPIYTEGDFVYMEKSEILKDEINKYASEPFKLKIEFDNNYNKALGGEYPYSALDQYFDAFESGYKLFVKYPETDYYKNIEDKFTDILIMFTDIHKVKNECFEGELHAEFYPWSTICNLPDLFTERFPNTVFTPVFEKIKENMSEFSNPKEPIYLIVTDIFDGKKAYLSGRNKVWEYLKKGIDVVHSIKVKNKEAEDVYYVTYRFYSDKTKADNALNKIKETLNNAEIKTVQIDENGYVNEI